MIHISPEDVGRRIDMREILTAKKIVGRIEKVTERMIVIMTDSHAKLFIPFPLLNRKYTIKVH